jgi:hypothetical protein
MTEQLLAQIDDPRHDHRGDLVTIVGSFFLLPAAHCVYEICLRKNSLIGPRLEIFKMKVFVCLPISNIC